jgi:hypothetical protein
VIFPFLFGSGALMIKDFVTMLNYFLKMGSGDRLTPTFIIEPCFSHSKDFAKIPIGTID